MHRAGLVVAVVLTCFAALAAPGAATPQSRSCLAPSGGDDTALLQAALDRCSGAGLHCKVDLCAGVFETGILRVGDFRGRLRGAGSRATTLRALPDLQVNPRADGFFRDDPLDPDSSPWPYLLQFVEGRATLRDFGVLIPAPLAGVRPTSGWSLFEGGDPILELRGAILITGRGRVDFDVSRVRVEAERDEQSLLETTTFHGVEFSGLLFDPEAPEPFPVFPLRGHYRLTDSQLVGMTNGSPLGELAHATVLVARNHYRSTIAIDVIDADRSQLAILSNRWHVSFRGVQVLQNLDGNVSEASGFLVDDNVGSLAPFLADLGDGVFFQDPIDASTTPGGSLLWATRNRLSLRNGEGPAASGITTNGASGLKLVGNRLSGEAGVGLAVDVTRGCLVSANRLGRLRTGGGPDLRLGPGTQGCLAVVAKDDVVQDDGSGNRVIHR
jgi:hypothetical protein